MKKLTTISLFIFWAVTTAILTAGLVFYQNNNTLIQRSPGLSNSLGVPSGDASSASSTVLNLAEISNHNSAGDCWMIINNKVYNFTAYLRAHPGGTGTMTPYCGQEATRAFNTKDINRPHSNYAGNLLANYLVGDFNQIITQKQIQQATKNINSVILPSRGRGDDEFDD